MEAEIKDKIRGGISGYVVDSLRSARWACGNKSYKKP